MRLAGCCLTLAPHVRFGACLRRLPADASAPGAFVDGPSAGCFEGGLVCCLEETAASVREGRGIAGAGVAEMEALGVAPGAGFVVGGRCVLTANEVRKLREQYGAGQGGGNSSGGGTWPGHEACLRCPRCAAMSAPARSGPGHPPTRVVMLFQRLLAEVDAGGGRRGISNRSIPRLACEPCFDAMLADLGERGAAYVRDGVSRGGDEDVLPYIPSKFFADGGAAGLKPHEDAARIDVHGLLGFWYQSGAFQAFTTAIQDAARWARMRCSLAVLGSAPHWTDETAGMRRAGCCLTLAQHCAFECRVVRLGANAAVAVQRDEGDGLVAFEGGTVVLLGETGESLQEARRCGRVTPATLPQASQASLVIGGECRLSAADVADLALHFRRDKSQFDWPEHVACLRCPRCAAVAAPDEEEEVRVLTFQMLSQLVDGAAAEGGAAAAAASAKVGKVGMRCVPRLMCYACFRFLAGDLLLDGLPLTPVTAITGLSGVRDAVCGAMTSGHDRLGAYELLRAWQESGAEGAFCADYAGSLARITGTRLSKGGTKANRGMPVTKAASAAQMSQKIASRFCALPGCPLRVQQAAAVRLRQASALKACAKCKKAFYCGRDCQLADWARHKTECKIFRSQLNELD